MATSNSYFHSKRSPQSDRSLIGPLAATLVACAFLFTATPEIDLAAAHFFFSAETGFIGLSQPVNDLRLAFKLAYVAICTLALAGLLSALANSGMIAGLTARKWLFLCLCLSVGPGLVCNVVFKNEWGRARPHQIVEFGGSKKFTPALEPASECRKNCSFTCGEASSIFMIFFAFAFLFRRRFHLLMFAGIAAGSLAGLIRMAQGGHFLSDVVFAGITMALVATALDYLIALIQEPARLTQEV